MNGRVPLAWRNATSDLKRLRRAATGIGFAVVLILVQLGFMHAFLDSSLHILQSFDGDLVIQSVTRYQFSQRETFDRRRLYQAMGVPGVRSVAPVFLDASTWKSPISGKTHVIRVIGIDPDNPAISLPDATAPLSTLEQPNTAMVDILSRRFLETTAPNITTDLAGRTVHVVGTFAMGPDFVNDGNLVTSERNFLTYFHDPVVPGLRRDQIEYGVIKVAPGYKVAAVQSALRKALPPDVSVLTKDRVLQNEIDYQNNLSPTGPIFTIGTLIGFLVGILITYQILFTEISDRLHLYATLKAMGYRRRYLMGVIVIQSLLYGISGFVPALLIALAIFSFVRLWMLLPMWITPSILVTTIGLLTVMCASAGTIAARRALVVDPAEVF